MNKGWIANAFWALIFVLGIVFLFHRSVDGAGIVQTPEVKLISLLVLGVVFLIVFAIQLVWRHFIKKRLA